MSAHQHWLAGEAACDRQNWKQAERAYRQALETDATHVPALIGLSTVLSRRGSHRAAYDATMAAWALRPRDPPLAFALAQRLRYFHEFAAVEDCLVGSGLAAHAPAHVVAKAVVMLSSIGAQAPAVAMAEAALRREPRDPSSLYVRGNLHMFSGEVAEAEACYEASLRSDPNFFQNSWMLAYARTQAPDSNHVDRIERQIAQVRPGSEGEAYLSYALHKELHDIGEDDDAAWRALERGCAAKRRNVAYDVASDVAIADAMVELCTPDFLAASAPVVQEHVPVFIVGMHRSGTTLLERILSGHSAIGDAGETNAFDAQVQLAADHASPGRLDLELLRRAPGIDFAEVARGYAAQARWLSRGSPLFTEKLPSNFWNVGFIAKALPQARILHLVRDPMDTCFSNLRTLFAGVAMYSYDQEELATFYLQYRRLMDHWRAVLPGRVLDVPYDELVSDPGAMAARIAAYCGIDYEPAMVDVTRSSGRVATASASLARQGIRKDRGNLWRRYEARLEPMRRMLEPLY